MRKAYRRVLLILGGWIVLSFAQWENNVYADEIMGTFTFDKMIPFVGLVYFPEEGVEVAAEGSPPAKVSVVDQVNKEFTKKLVVGQKGGKILFKNSDDIDHNVYANDSKAGVAFDVGLMAPGKEASVPMNWEEGKIIHIGCKIHPRMRAYIANIPGSHHQVVDFDEKSSVASFKMSGVPSTLTHLSVWFPRFTPLEVDLKAGEKKTVNIMKGANVYGSLVLERK